MNTKAIIDFAQDEDGSAFREALYTEIQQRVHAHIDAKRQEIAQNLIAQQEVVSNEEV
jgi:hypothetical protein